MVALATLAAVVVAMVSCSVSQDAQSSVNSIVTNSGVMTDGDGTSITITNNYNSADGAPGESAPVASGNCGAADSDIIGGWGPERPVFVSSVRPTYTTFNAIRDNPQIGDERGLMRVRDLDDVDSTYDYEVEVVEGHTYQIGIFVENSAAAPELFASATKVRVTLPVCDGERISANAFIESADAFPMTIWGGITFTADRTFNLAYVSDSARMATGPTSSEAAPIDGATMMSTEGILLGEDGLVQVGDDGQTWITFSVRPQFAAE